MLFVLILGPVEVALAMLSGRGFHYYYMALLPVSALYLGFLVWLLSTEKLVAPALLSFILLYTTVNYNTDIYSKARDIVRTIRGTEETYSAIDLKRRTIARDRSRELHLVETVKHNSRSNDTILVWGNLVRIYLLAERDSPTRFSYQTPLVESDYAEKSDFDEFISEVKNARPAVIIDTRHSRLPPLDEESRRDWQPPRRYLHDPAVFQDLFDFLETEYRLIEEIDRFRVYAINRVE